ncbi:hypothetical protein [Winogradskyella pulchriflava]|uniref:Lipoprotein n=1 Tax=Winogradskyella pulchriflava TaxID=1110688 RepID=A0ABV6QA84_9FLAO
MKKVLLFVITLSFLTLNSCSSSSDDDSGGSNYPQTVNIKFEALANTGGNLQVLATTIDNDSEDHLETLPFSYTYAQQEVNIGTYLKVQFQTQSFTIGEEIELKILVDNQSVKSEVFTITQENQVGSIEYTFE